MTKLTMFDVPNKALPDDGIFLGLSAENHAPLLLSTRDYFVDPVIFLGPLCSGKTEWIRMIISFIRRRRQTDLATYVIAPNDELAIPHIFQPGSLTLSQALRNLAFGMIQRENHFSPLPPSRPIILIDNLWECLKEFTETDMHNFFYIAHRTAENKGPIVIATADSDERHQQPPSHYQPFRIVFKSSVPEVRMFEDASGTVYYIPSID